MRVLHFQDPVTKPSRYSRARVRGIEAILAAVLVIAPIVTGCATWNELAALRQVRFDLDRVTDVRVAGIRLDDRRDYSDLTAGEAARLAAAVLAEDVPLDLVLHVQATNPEDNRVAARLVDFDWTLFLEDRETVSGSVGGEYRLPPGEPVGIPVEAHLDLVDFFRGSARDAFELALAIAGYGGAPKEVRLEAMPTIETGIGPIRYPRPVVVRRVVGGR